MNIFSLIFFLLGYILATCMFWILYNPNKTFQEGYSTAQNIFSDWDKGYQEGWNDGYNEIIKEKACYNLKAKREESELNNLFIELY